MRLCSPSQIRPSESGFRDVPRLGDHRTLFRVRRRDRGRDVAARRFLDHRVLHRRPLATVVVGRDVDGRHDVRGGHTVSGHRAGRELRCCRELAVVEHGHERDLDRFLTRAYGGGRASSPTPSSASYDTVAGLPRSCAASAPHTWPYPSTSSSWAGSTWR